MTNMIRNEKIAKSRFWVLVGTRPEVIKQAALYIELVKKFGSDEVCLIGTGQHKELLEQALAHFNLKLDINFSIMKDSQTLTGSAAAVLLGMEELIAVKKPEWLIVQGDTTTAAMAGWAGFLNGIKVAHNEAGLRSYNLQHPFPEEANRRLISVVADAHFAPTELAANALIKEGTDAKRVFITGNTGIDALRLTLEMKCPESISTLLSKVKSQKLRPVLMTAHRRENRGETMNNWFSALRKFIDDHSDLALIYPMHPNNAGREAAEKFLSSSDRVFLMNPLNYGETCHLLRGSDFVVTDSGGIQEEASTLGLPVVVCRKTSERMEAIYAGRAVLAGTDIDGILKSMNWANEKSITEKNSDKNNFINIFGDGFSSAKICEILQSYK